MIEGKLTVILPVPAGSSSILTQLSSLKPSVFSRVARRAFALWLTAALDHRPERTARSNRAKLTDRSFKNSGKHSTDLAADGARVGGILNDILR